MKKNIPKDLVNSHYFALPGCLHKSILKKLKNRVRFSKYNYERSDYFKAYYKENKRKMKIQSINNYYKKIGKTHLCIEI